MTEKRGRDTGLEWVGRILFVLVVLIAFRVLSGTYDLHPLVAGLIALVIAAVAGALAVFVTTAVKSLGSGRGDAQD